MTKLLCSTEINNILFEVYDDRPNFKFIGVNQIHSSIIEYSKNISSTINADGIITEIPIITPIAIKTADCVPIAIIGQTEVALIHAGWKGLAGGILKSTAIEKIGPTTIIIGPNIKSCCYEIQPDFINNISNGQYYCIRKDNKYYFDLTRYATDELKRKFINTSIIISPTCTMCDTDYNSYRRDKTSKRNFNILRVKI